MTLQNPDMDSAYKDELEQRGPEVLESDVVEAELIDEPAGEEVIEPDAHEQAQDEIANEAPSDPLAEAQEQARAFQDRFLRLQAEWDNYRKRTAQEAQQQRARAAEHLFEALIPIIDDLERALDHAETSKPEGEFAAFVEGVSAVHSKFVSALEAKGLVTIDPAGEPFDALKHQAVGQVEDEEQYEDTVAAVYQKGYELGGYVLRPAMVTITTGGTQRPAQEA